MRWYKVFTIKLCVELESILHEFSELIEKHILYIPSCRLAAYNIYLEYEMKIVDN